MRIILIILILAGCASQPTWEERMLSMQSETQRMHTENQIRFKNLQEKKMQRFLEYREAEFSVGTENIDELIRAASGK